jgi:hypothetical protein
MDNYLVFFMVIRLKQRNILEKFISYIFPNYWSFSAVLWRSVRKKIYAQNNKC